MAGTLSYYGHFSVVFDEYSQTLSVQNFRTLSNSLQKALTMPRMYFVLPPHFTPSARSAFLLNTPLWLGLPVISPFQNLPADTHKGISVTHDRPESVDRIPVFCAPVTAMPQRSSIST